MDIEFNGNFGAKFRHAQMSMQDRPGFWIEYNKVRSFKEGIEKPLGLAVGIVPNEDSYLRPVTTYLVEYAEDRSVF